MKEELYIRRNIPECMGMAWTLMTTNIRRMAAALWLPAVIMAVVSAAVATICSIQQTRLLTGGDDLTYWIWVVGTAIVTLAAAIFLEAKVYKLLNLKPLGYCIRRTAAVTGINILLILVATIIVTALFALNFYLAAQGKVATTVGLVLFIAEAIVAIVLMVIFFCPMIYTLMKYMIDPVTLRAIWTNYRVGLRSAGFIIAFFLLCAIVMMLLYIIIGLPSVIVNAAFTLSTAGMAMGDPSGLPDNFLLIAAITMFITAFVAIILRIWSIFATYYMYASIEAKNGRTDDKNEDETGEQQEKGAL